MNLPTLATVRVAVIGLGYVGLPLAAYMGRIFPTLGFDIDKGRVAELKAGIDRTREVTEAEFRKAERISFSSNSGDLKASNFYIVTVPTPVAGANRPDLSALEKASATVGAAISRGDIVVYESTVYPGATEEICVPIIEQTSGLVFNRDFFAGYSPERINPGDQQHRLPDIAKVTSGSTPMAAEVIDAVYSRIITAGTYKASSIRVAEAAKVIENIQRDVNIALVNELCMLFKKLGLETREVLDAAATKWNFHRYQPGLVGGHCIGVDPYYLTHKAQSIGFHPEIILAGRRINDGMPTFVAHDVIKTMVRHKLRVDTARVLVLGFTFKENCPDTRNTKIAGCVKELQDFVEEVVVYDPYAEPEVALHEYGIVVTNTLPRDTFDGIVLAVRHDKIIELGRDAQQAMLKPEGGVIYDVKGLLPASQSQGRL